MDLEKAIYRSGMALTLGVAIGTAVWDLQNEFETQARISAINVSPDERVKQCGQENNQCNTSHAVLNECLLRKASKIHSDINTILEQRSDVKVPLRAALILSLCHLGFLWQMQKINSLPARRGAAPQSSSKDPHPQV